MRPKISRLPRCLRHSLTLILFTVTVHSAPAAAVSPPDPIAALRTVMSDRLALMPAVAAYKWNHHLPVQDMTRESSLLDKMISAAEKNGFDHDYAITMISAQIEAGKAVQNRLIDGWRFNQAGLQENERDLKGDLRPKITALTEKFLLAVKAARPELTSCKAQDQLREPPEGLEDDIMAWRIAADGIIDSEPCR